MSIYDGIVTAVIGAITGGIFVYYGSVRVARHHSFNEAAAKFRSAFFEEIYRLETGRDEVFKILNDAAYVAHQKARIEFEPYLTKMECKGLNEVWQRYYQYRNFEGQKVAPGSTDARDAEIPNAQEIIKDILRFANNK